jgi:hypothetical protein
MYNRIISYAFKYGLLTEEQFAFRDGKSTELASQIFIEYIQEVLDNQSYVIGIFLDLTKAYSVLNHHFIGEIRILQYLGYFKKVV